MTHEFPDPSVFPDPLFEVAQEIIDSTNKIRGKEGQVGKPLTSTLLTSIFVFRSGSSPFGGFKLAGSLVATSLEGFSVTSQERKGTKGPFCRSFKGQHDD